MIQGECVSIAERCKVLCAEIIQREILGTLLFLPGAVTSPKVSCNITVGCGHRCGQDADQSLLQGFPSCHLEPTHHFPPQPLSNLWPSQNCSPFLEMCHFKNIVGMESHSIYTLGIDISSLSTALWHSTQGAVCDQLLAPFHHSVVFRGRN